MLITDYILYFSKACHSPALSLEQRERAEHFFIGLALDLPDVPAARKYLFRKVPAYKKDFLRCGKNIPEDFQRLLEEKIHSETPPAIFTGADLDGMIDHFHRAVQTYYGSTAVTAAYPGPLCCHPANTDNLSAPPAGTEWCRYISLLVFENCVYHPIRLGRAGTPPGRRRSIYNNAWIARFNTDPALLRGGRPLMFSLGNPNSNLPMPDDPVFLTPMAEAPHRDGHPQSQEATYVAQEMGLLDHLQHTPPPTANDGVVALIYRHDADDRLYAPTFLDAFAHIAFRPGPIKSPSVPYRYGWTRRCQNFSAMAIHVIVLAEKGRRELIMKNKQVPLPAHSLQVDAVLFFDGSP